MRVLAAIGILAILAAIVAAVFFFGGFYRVAANDTDEGTKGRPAYRHESYFFVWRCLPKAAATSLFLMRADWLPR